MIGCLINPDPCLADAQMWLVGFLPDWLTFLFAVPVPVWWLLSLALVYVWGRFGLGGALVAVILGFGSYIIARASMRSEPSGEWGELDNDPHPSPQPRPRRRLRDLFKRP